MIFSSLVFISIFLPVVLGVYYLLPNLKLKNALLICASIFFYAYGEPFYILLMLINVLLNYIFARCIAAGRGKGKTVFLVLTLIWNLGCMAVFKYAGFFAQSWNAVTKMHVTVPDIALPLGISFYTFQALSYVIDVYRGEVEALKSFPKLLLYISFFPQLVAGPIVKYKDISMALTARTHDVSLVAEGLRRFVCGLSKKVLIANTMGKAADAVFAISPSNVNIAVAWIGAVSYMMQIYYDFSGYSDMAIGLGKMFGFHFKENFQYPYGADNVQDFWRKWHISLSTWFKEYLYIPLGGNRKGKARTCLNKIIVFFFTGLWHGANWTFVIWGLWHGAFLLLEEYIPAIKKMPKVLTKIYTLLVVCVGFVIFRADTLSQGIFMIGQMFTGFSGNDAAMSLAWEQLTPWFFFMLAVAVIGAAPVKKISDKIRSQILQEQIEGKWKVVDIVLFVLSFVLLLWCMVRLSGGTYNPFIYFRF